MEIDRSGVERGESGDRQEEEWVGEGESGDRLEWKGGVGIDRSGVGRGSGDRQEGGREESGDRHGRVGWEGECGWS